MRSATIMFRSAGLAVALVGAISCASAAAPAYDHSLRPDRTFTPSVPPWWLGYATELVSNGSFESGDFTSWTVFNDAGGAGNWFATDQIVTPLSGGANPSAADASFQAMTDQSGPGLHILYQDVTIPASTSVTLNLMVWVENYGGSYADAGSLDPTGGPNQQVRVDIMDPAAPIDDVSKGVLLNVFKTSPGDPNSIPQTPLTADLTDLQGQTVRIRFAEVDNLFYFNAGVDAVSIGADATATRRAAWGAVKTRYR